MRTLFIFGLTLLVLTSQSQSIIDDYIADGLKNNIVLQQRNIALDQAMLSLKIAKGSFLPNVSLQGSYTSGSGGRSISIPVGDLMNPVYNTLNQLTESNAFPQIENVNQNFFPNNFYDVHVRTSMPIYNSNLIYARRIAAQQIQLKEYEVQEYKRELVKEIKTAYYNYRVATEAVLIYENALNVALEGKRVNESLFANGKGLQAYVIRSEGEVEKIQANIQQAHSRQNDSKLYFNFLLNRDQDAPIDTSFDPQTEQLSFTLADDFSIQQREEVQQIQQAVLLNESVLKMKRSYWKPTVSAFLDLGSQQQDWIFNGQSKYHLFGVQLDVPLFAGFTNKNRINQSRLELSSTELSRQNLSNGIELKVRSSLNAVNVAIQNYASSIKQLEAAQSYHRLIEKGYREGVNTFIEIIDARNQLTAAQLLSTINQYEVLTAKANYERETSSYIFKN